MRKNTKVLASAALMSLVLTTALSTVHVKAAPGQVTRIGEADRYITAAKVATINWTTSDNVVLVSGEGYADAVSASALAKKLNAPILLTTAGSLNTAAESALSTLKVKNVYVVGGKASVSQSVRDALKAKYMLIELGGANRYETNAAVAEKLVELGTDPTNVMMVGGEGFSDAISVSPIAAAKGEILLLGNNNTDSIKPVLNFINKNKSKVTVVGNKNVVNDEVLNSVNGTRVDGGKNRWDTNLKILSAFKDSIKTDKVYIASSSCSAKDDGYADALVASTLAGKTGSPLVLIDREGTDATTNAMKYIKTNVSKAADINVIGGTNVISQTIVDDINKTVSTSEVETGEPTVKSIEAVSLNQIAVHFNTAVNSDSVEDVTNYKIDGVQLTRADDYRKAVDENSAVATAPDGKTVLITLATPRKQNDNIKVSVKKGILTSDKKNSIADFEQNVTFYDTQTPVLKSVTSQGNDQITVEFSEPINMGNINKLASEFQIDGKNIEGYGLDNSSSLTKIKIPMIVGDKNWSKKVVFYFDSPIESGKHTLKVSDGDGDGLLSDAAGFVFKESSRDFQIDKNTSKPSIKSVKETANGEVSITFDRSMDLKTAKDKSNYEINGKKLSDIKGASTTTSSNDTIVKLKKITDGTITNGSNVVYINSSVKDVYGNKVDDDTRVSFEHVRDKTKPQIISVSPIDNKTIRVQFNKNVKYSYATSISNYKLKDSRGIDITDHIEGIYNSKDKTYTTDTDIYDIKLKKNNPNDAKDDWRLTGPTYSLTIKNIVDTEYNPNTMDDYTAAITGIDDTAPKVTGVYYKQNGYAGKNEVVVYFSEAMDSGTITNKDNYRFVNGKGDNKTLPGSATISSGGDNKSAIIEFPSNYKVKTADAGDSISNTGIDTDVLKIIVSNVKNESENLLDIAYTGVISENSTSAQVKPNTIKLYYGGDDLKADVYFDKAVDNVTANDFTLGGAAPTSISASDDKVTLTFEKGDLASDSEKNSVPEITFSNGKINKNQNTTKIDLIKAQGQKAYLGIKPGAKTTDEAGTSISSLQDTSGTSQNTIYDYEAAPKTAANYWTAVKDENGGKIYLTFDTVLCKNSGVKTDDFIFTAEDGTNLEADSVSVNENTVEFTFNKDNKNIVSFSNTIKVLPKSTVSIETERDDDGNYAKYVPSSDDLKEITINITGRN